VKPGSKYAKNLFLYFGVFITILAIAYYIYYFASHVSEIPELEFGSKTLLVCFATVLLYLVIIVAGGTVWYLFLIFYRQPISWLNTQIIYGQAQFGKYLPGNFAHHVGRVVLSRRQGVETPVIVSSMILEMVWAIAIGLAVAAVASVGNASYLFGSEYGYPEFFVASVVFAILVILPYIFLSFLKRNALTGSGGLRYLYKLGLPDVLSLVKVIVLYVISFLMFGVILVLQAKYLFNVHTVNPVLLVGIFSWAWTVGFITPGSPAGLGVRDTVLLAALTPLYGSGVALGLSLGIRLVTTLGDGVWFLVSLLTPTVVRGNSVKSNSE
jgi:hypothetical protein